MKNKFLIAFSRIIVGLLFIFSGLIKANDPLGFGYKLQEYFEVFHILFLNDYATAIAIFLCALEMILGAALLFGIKSRQVVLGLLLLIIFFTFLTFYSAYFDVVKTCGCFGDSIPLTPWQSFSKDLILLILIIVLFINRDQIGPLIRSQKARQLILIVITILSFGFGMYTYNYLPVMDFLPYKIGANIPAGMKMPPGAEPDVYEITYTLKNKKTGETQKMTDKEYLKKQIWKDANWEIVGEPLNRLLRKGYEVKIKDLQLSDEQGTEYTREIIENPYYNLIIVAYNLDATNKNAINELNALAINATEGYNIRTVLLTTNSPEDMEMFSKAHNLAVEVFYADAVPLKSMVRSNPGLLLLKNGTVVNKWPFRTLPSYRQLEETYFQKQ